MKQTLLISLSAALLVTAFAATPVIHTNVIKLGYECTKTPKNCAPGLICAGKPYKKTCVTPKHPGMQCRIEPFWVCRSELVCVNDVCKIPVGVNCSRNTDQCVEGSECTGTGDDKKCTPIPAKLGEKCDNDAIKCETGLACDNDICKLTGGNRCTDTPDLCASGLNCDGKGDEKRCITYKQAGQGCLAAELFWICAPGLTCEGDVCKIPVGDNCSSSPENCVDGAECTGSGNSKTCTPIPAMLGEKCNDSSMKCATGLVCDDDTCKLPQGSTCTDTPTQCASGLTCGGNGSDKKCIILQPAGKECPKDNEFLVCAPGLECQDEVCKIPVGEKCSSAPAECVSGAECTGSGNGKTCKPIPAMLGEKCNDSTMKCASGLTCDDDICKLPRGKTCTDTPDLCAGGLACDGKGPEKRCIVFKQPGMGCPANELFWICAPGLTCEGDVCKIPLGDNCSSSPANCVASAECTGTGNGKTCTPIPSKLGEECNNTSMKCESGLTCDNEVCKLPRGSTCTDNTDLCASGLICAGRGSEKKCIVYQNAGDECAKDNPFQICAPGLTCEDEKCKIPLNKDCSASPGNCVDGAECTGSGNSKTCTPIPAMLGEKCNNTSMKCASGLTCDDNVCKLRPGQVCTKTPTLCASGLSCGGKRSVKRCITYKVAGMRCPAREDFWICDPSLTCERDVCKIPVGGSCSSSSRNCVAGTTCAGSGSSKKCTIIPRRAGEKCDTTFKCESGLTCEGTCKLGKKAACERTPTLCARGLACVGTRRKKNCVPLVTENGRCGEIGFRICERHLVCFRSRCVRGTVGERGRCGGHSVCKSGLVCAGTSRNMLCVKPMKVGQKCDIEPYWKCGTGLRCSRNRCREY